jgi:integrase
MKIDTTTARRRLASRREPYYITVSPGRSLGFRRFQGDLGHWLARYRNKSKKYSHKPLGTDAELTHEQALEAASEWFVEQAASDGDDRRPVTVEMAVRSYLDYLGDQKKGSTFETAESRAKNHILPKLGDVLLSDLTARQVRDWHHRLVGRTEDDDQRRARQASANRVLTIFKTACNRATFGRKGIDVSAWQSVKPFGKTATSRAVFWSKVEIERLVNCCRDEGLRDLVLAGWLTGGRLGELTQATVSDFDAGGDTWNLRVGKTGARTVVLVAKAAELFSRRTAGRKPGEQLFTRSDGTAWNKENIQRPLREALERAGLEGTFYALRHSHISFALNQAVPIKAVSANVGSGLPMLQMHYSHILDRDRRDAYVAAGFGGSGKGTVTKIDRAAS